MNSRIAMLTEKSMEMNITISNLDGDQPKDENCKQNVIDFSKSEVQIDAELNEIFVAYRLGKHKNDQKRPRLMLVRLNLSLKERIFANIANLKGKVNEAGNKYFINKQKPAEGFQRVPYRKKHPPEALLNVVVFVVRNCGPYQIGQKRFTHINTVAQEVIARLGK